MSTRIFPWIRWQLPVLGSSVRCDQIVYGRLEIERGHLLVEALAGHSEGIPSPCLLLASRALALLALHIAFTPMLVEGPLLW
jgi:hypothetical protein